MNFTLGIDSELIGSTPKGMLWPHQCGLEQERTSTKDVFDWHADGFAWELCVAPASEPSQVVNHVAQGLTMLWKSQGFRSLHGPSLYRVPQSVYASAPRDVVRLGCMPSYNVYGDGAIPAGLPKTMRSTGCHIHVASTDITKENYANIIKWADILVGNTWTYISPEPIVDERRRRRYYGRAGEYRVRYYDEAKTTLGVEYRTLPGLVLHHPLYLNLMLRLMLEAAQAGVEGMPEEVWSDEVRANINRADRIGAGYVFEDLNMLGPSVIEQVELARKIKARGFRLNPWIDVLK